MIVGVVIQVTVESLYHFQTGGMFWKRERSDRNPPVGRLHVSGTADRSFQSRSSDLCCPCLFIVDQHDA
jgi:hypothetical protein